MPPSLKVLFCDDDANMHAIFKQALKGQAETRSAYNSDEALAILKNHPIDVIILDVEMRAKDEGLRAIGALRAVDPEISIIMASGRTDFETVREAMRLGANDYVSKDFAPEELIHVIGRIRERRAIQRKSEQKDFELGSQQRQHILVGESPKLIALRRIIEKVRQSSANVVIFGETGTGKEVVARQIRRPHPDGGFSPFVAVDSSTIQGSTAESLLFGHEKGAFTGAEKATKGIFEEANGGVVYFDEIANMPLDIQAKLLRVIQEKEFARLGSAKIIPSEFRVICATNRDLDVMVQQGSFKDDLLQRLNVLPISLPPLRERTEDIPLLIDYFLKKQPRPSLQFTAEAIEAMKDYHWPGNVRELANIIAYLNAMTETDEIDVQDLPPKIRDQGRRPKKSEAGNGSFYDRVGTFEKELLSGEYRRNEGNISRMATELGMDRSHLYTKLKEHGIHVSKK